MPYSGTSSSRAKINLMNKLPFPTDFLWGAATSSHQVEGGNNRNDWWAWEKRVQPKEKQSGAAADQWNSWEEDVALIKELGHTCHRLSLEWSRVEPEDGIFNEEAPRALSGAAPGPEGERNQNHRHPSPLYQSSLALGAGRLVELLRRKTLYPVCRGRDQSARG